LEARQGGRARPSPRSRRSSCLCDERRLATSQPAPTAVRPAPGPTDDLAPPQVPAVSQTAPAADRSLPQSTATTSPASSLDATLDRSGVPPSARRRPTAIRPTSELRQAVAAQSRAPRPRDHSCRKSLRAPQTRRFRPRSRRRPRRVRPGHLPFEEGPPISWPLQPAAQHGPVVARKPSPARDHTGDPHEDFARLAGAHPLPHCAEAPRQPTVGRAAGSRLSAVEASQPSPVQEATGPGGSRVAFCGSSSEAAQASEPHSPSRSQFSSSLLLTRRSLKSRLRHSCARAAFPRPVQHRCPVLADRRAALVCPSARKPLPAALRRWSPPSPLRRPWRAGVQADVLGTASEQPMHCSVVRLSTPSEKGARAGQHARRHPPLRLGHRDRRAVVAAAGAAAASRPSGPVNHPGVQGHLEEARTNVALKNSDFPLTWHVSNDALTAGSYGFGSVFNSPRSSSPGSPHTVVCHRLHDVAPA